MKNLDETHHVFTAHTFNELSIIEGEESEYSKEELLAKIATTMKQVDDFEKNWLIPILDELEKLRAIEYIA